MAESTETLQKGSSGRGRVASSGAKVVACVSRYFTVTVY